MLRAALFSLAVFGFAFTQISAEAADEKKTGPALDYTMNSLAGEEVDLGEYQGKVAMVVNVASRCGLTPQYAGLQDLYEKYNDQGFVLLAFPCNQFGKQEPGSAAEIREFCTTNYGVEFPMFAKIDVNGDDAAPLYKYLTQQAGEKYAGPISWNFEKFIINRDGEVVARFSPRTKPTDAELIKTIEAELKKKPTN